MLRTVTLTFTGLTLQCYKSHDADVNALCLSPDGRTVFASGVEPKVVRFQLIAGPQTDAWPVWVTASVKAQHTNDVRALTLAGDCIVSAGLSTAPACFVPSELVLGLWVGTSALLCNEVSDV